MFLRTILFLLSLSLLAACVSTPNQKHTSISHEDSLEIISMIKQREDAMISRDINTVVRQFDSGAYFINGGGFLYQGIAEIRNFHNSMFTNDSLTYTYTAGTVWIQPVREDLAMIYYPWQQQWTMKNVQSDTLNEVGLMTITAVKQSDGWKWKAVTNQRTKEYFDDLLDHKARPIN